MSPRRLLCFLVAVGSMAGPLTAADISDPVGVFRIRLRGNSDTLTSLPLQRPALLASSLASRTGAALTLADAVPALPAGGAFVLVMSGALEGAVLPITNASGSVVNVDTGAFDLSVLKLPTASATGDLIDIVPYWTLDTLFPSGAGVNPSASANTRDTEILLFDSAQAGTNLSASAIYYYFVGNAAKPANWFKVGDTSTVRGATRLEPHTYFVVRHNIATDTTLSIFGGVQMSGYRVAVGLRSANLDQDNLIGLPIATPVALGAARLVESGAFTPSPSASSRVDELLVFDNTSIAKNKSASAILYYFAGNTAKAAGWYKVGDTLTVMDGFLLKPGEGYVIRRHQQTAPRADQWNGLPPYLK